MPATPVVPDLGLDLRKLPDLTDAATRKRLSPAAIEAFFKIVENWDLKNEDAMALLGGFSHGRYYGLKKTHQGVLTQDELTRISLLIGIFKSLNILFTGSWRTNGFLGPMVIPCSTTRHLWSCSFRAACQACCWSAGY